MKQNYSNIFSKFSHKGWTYFHIFYYDVLLEQNSVPVQKNSELSREKQYHRIGGRAI